MRWRASAGRPALLEPDLARVHEIDQQVYRVLVEVAVLPAPRRVDGVEVVFDWLVQVGGFGLSTYIFETEIECLVEQVVGCAFVGFASRSDSTEIEESGLPERADVDVAGLDARGKQVQCLPDELFPGREHGRVVAEDADLQEIVVG